MCRLLLTRSFDRSFSSIAPPTANNFSFGGCGFLVSYHLGVAQGLLDAGYIQANSKFAGASGGAIVALSLAANANISDIFDEVKGITRLCHNHGTVWKLEKRLQKMWPWRALVLTDDFHSTDDLCDALIASCYVPWYLSRRGMSVFRGEYHVDGGLITLVPKVPGYTKVCAFPGHIIRRTDYEISPSIDPDFPFTIMQLARFALFPPRIEVLDQLFESGKRSARIWVEKSAAQTGENDTTRSTRS
ncbi:unnamed protein product [Peronospora farinosa]|uniref:PNPLA domain-containing protein n=1 Tax=Peronospora farinosa TaxID=134698 RepID=A0AAV0SYX1_9STRA|nr:unnamed protein product [Peronospora farinosa]